MHTMNGVNVELTTRTGLVNDGRVFVRRRGVPPPICLYLFHTFSRIHTRSYTKSLILAERVAELRRHCLAPSGELVAPRVTRDTRLASNRVLTVVTTRSTRRALRAAVNKTRRRSNCPYESKSKLTLWRTRSGSNSLERAGRFQL